MILIKSSETLNLNGLTHNDLLGVVQIAIRDTEERLQQFAQRPDFREKMILAFGTSPEGLQGAWANGVRNVGFKAKEDSGIVVFIDPSVSDYQTLQAGVAEGVEAIALNPNQDGIKQITAFLRQHPQITTIHIVSHGAPGCLYLGNSQLNLDSISKYADLLQHWQSNSILLYGCNVAAGDVGEEFIRKLHQITKANIRASATKTGNAALGGNWELEVSFPVTDGKKSVAFHPEVLAAYSGILALELINLGNGGSNPNYLTNVNGIVGQIIRVEQNTAILNTELTEGNANYWNTFASDGANATVSNDTNFVKIGSQSLKFVTESGFDTGIKYQIPEDARWDLTGITHLEFWAYAINNTPIGFQGNQPVIILNSPNGSFRYEPQGSLGTMPLNRWIKYSLPLTGDSEWSLTKPIIPP